MKSLKICGKCFDANYEVIEDEAGSAIVWASRGGTSSTATNSEYLPALETLLHALAGVTIIAIHVDSHQVDHLSKSERLLELAGFPYPIMLSSRREAHELRLSVSQTSKKIGQQPGASGGNPTRRLRITFDERYKNLVARLTALEEPLIQSVD